MIILNKYKTKLAKRSYTHAQNNIYMYLFYIYTRRIRGNAICCRNDFLFSKQGPPPVYGNKTIGPPGKRDGESAEYSHTVIREFFGMKLVTGNASNCISVLYNLPRFVNSKVVL